MKKLLFVLIVCFVTSFLGCQEENPPVNDVTSLTIIVKDASGNLVADANVMIFSNGNDWSNKANPVKPKQTTTAGGKVIFTELSPIEYWVNVEKGALNNWFTTINTSGAIPDKKQTELTVLIN